MSINCLKANDSYGFTWSPESLVKSIINQKDIFAFINGRKPTTLVLSPNDFELIESYVAENVINEGIVEVRLSIETFEGMRVVLNPACHNWFSIY